MDTAEPAVVDELLTTGARGAAAAAPIVTAVPDSLICVGVLNPSFHKAYIVLAETAETADTPEIDGRALTWLATGGVEYGLITRART